MGAVGDGTTDCVGEGSGVAVGVGSGVGSGSGVGVGTGSTVTVTAVDSAALIDASAGTNRTDTESEPVGAGHGV